MRWKSCAAVLAVIVGCASIAQAEPSGRGLPVITGANAFIVPVGGCHRSERTHYVPEVGRSLPHVHIGEDCDPYRLSDSDADDDDDEVVDDDDDDLYDPDDAPRFASKIGDVEVCTDPAAVSFVGGFAAPVLQAGGLARLSSALPERGVTFHSGHG